MSLLAGWSPPTPGAKCLPRTAAPAWWSPWAATPPGTSLPCPGATRAAQGREAHGQALCQRVCEGDRRGETPKQRLDRQTNRQAHRLNDDHATGPVHTQRVQHRRRAVVCAGGQACGSGGAWKSHFSAVARQAVVPLSSSRRHSKPGRPSVACAGGVARRRREVDTHGPGEMGTHAREGRPRVVCCTSEFITCTMTLSASGWRRCLPSGRAGTWRARR